METRCSLGKPRFLYADWMAKTLREYATSKGPYLIRGRKVVMTLRQYGAALSQAYFGRSSLEWIAEQTRIPLRTLKDWRRQPEFLFLMDWSKVSFAEAFQQDLMLKDYSVTEYHEISAEFSLLEESLRIAVRTKLYGRFKRISEKLISRSRYGFSLERFDLRLFNRLFLFFFALEHHWPSAAKSQAEKEWLPFAKEVVWPQLGSQVELEKELEIIQKNYRRSQIRVRLAEQIRSIFAEVPTEYLLDS